MRSVGETEDLFTSSDPQPEVSLREEQRPGVGSIEYFAKEQKRLYEEGVKSASAYWLARGKVWP